MILIVIIYREAKLVLKKKRLYEQKIEKIHDQFDNLDQKIFYQEYLKIISDNKEFPEAEKNQYVMLMSFMFLISFLIIYSLPKSKQR
jgi:hypothetical protein